MAAHGYTQRSRGNLEMGLQMWMPQCRAVQTGTSPSPRCPQGAGAVPTGMVAILSVHRAAHCCLVQNTLLLIVRRVVQLLSPVRLFETPWTVAHQAPLSMGFSRQEYWGGLPFSSPGDLPDPGIKPTPLHWQVNSLPTEPQGSPYTSL